MLHCLTWKFKTWFPKFMKKTLMNNWCPAWCEYELHTRKMLNSKLWNSMWEISLCVSYLFVPYLKKARRHCPSGLWARWTVVLTQYSWCCFLSELIIECLLSWIWPFNLRTLRKTWITICDYSMFLFRWSEDHLCYSKNLAGSTCWVYQRTW